jgi:hypothetical protein
LYSIQNWVKATFFKNLLHGIVILIANLGFLKIWC